MKESIGMAWLMIIVMTFMVLFSSYLAFSINYSKSFRVKDGIVERIQKHNGFVNNGSKDTLNEINKFLGEINYNAKGNCHKLCKDEGQHFVGVNGVNFDRDDATKGKLYNYCIIKVKNVPPGGPSVDNAEYSATYYKVLVFFSLQIGNISLFSTFHTTGETQTIYFASDSYVFGAE